MAWIKAASLAVLALLSFPPDMSQAQSMGGGGGMGAMGASTRDGNAPRSVRNRQRREQAATAEAARGEQTALQAGLIAAGAPCTVIESRSVGTSGGARIYEAACEAGSGFMVVMSDPPQAIPCGDLTAPGAGSSSPRCVLPGNQRSGPGEAAPAPGA